MKDSLRKQIITAVLVSQLLLAMGLTLAIVLYGRAQLLAGFDIMLEGRAASVLAAIHDSEDATQSLVLDHKGLNLPSDDLLEVREENGDLIWRSKNWQGPPASVIASAASTFGLSTGQSAYRGIVAHKTVIIDEEDNRPGLPRKVTVVYASSTRELDRRIFKIGLFAAGSSLLFLLGAGLFAAHRVTKGLLPMQELATEAARVSAHDWNFNPPEAARRKRELAPLVDALEATLGGLQRAFNREREFMADAAHELKTAVAILKSSLQLLVCQSLSIDEYKKGLGRSLEDCDRLEALACSTLTLARAEQRTDAGQADNLQPIDLVNSCEQSIADVQSLAHARGVRLRCAANDEAMVKADFADLQTVWVNLLQNAIQHSPEGSIVSVKVDGSDHDTACVVVEDSGTGIPPEELPHVFERFRRGDPSRSRTTGGFGLGLSICKAIVETYGGHIHITSPSGSGTRVSVSLPAMAPAPSEDRAVALSSGQKS
jgi:signal transduction histidine kinase